MTRAGKLPAIHPENGEVIQENMIYVAPTDYHMDVNPGRIRLSRGPRENGYRPAIDRMFRTAARAYGQRVVGVVLSGMLSDGALGLQTIQEAGGLAIVQDPQEALYPGMPENALRSVTADAVLSLAGIANRIIQLAEEPARSEPYDSPLDVSEQAQTDQEAYRLAKDNNNNPRSLLTCPSCGGVLWEMQEGSQKMYLCQTGHRFSLESMFEHQSNGTESALWSALRVLEERVTLTRRLAEMSAKQGHSHSYKRFLDVSQQAEQDASAIREILERANRPSLEDLPDIGPESELPDQPGKGALKENSD